jgi:hypothetical protein
MTSSTTLDIQPKGLYNQVIRRPMVDVANDMNMMHAHYGIHEAVSKLSREQLREFLGFRFRFLQEELAEGNKALIDQHPEEIVDSLIDLVVVAVGTLDLFNVDFRKAWNEVLEANLNKKVGVKPNRPNPLGLPDLIKPEGWKGPDHSGNHGMLPSIFEA